LLTVPARAILTPRFQSPPDERQGSGQSGHEIGGLDALVHAAGVHATRVVADAPLADLDRLWSVNARAPWTLTRTLLPALAARQGSVVFINSSIWSNARGGLGGYAASKYALKAMADALREEVNSQGVRVPSVFPGRTATSMH
jgi:NAD(P)-dependent dehydrogenase (short-subunit alcohol dehydrogenase family)